MLPRVVTKACPTGEARFQTIKEREEEIFGATQKMGGGHSLETSKVEGMNISSRVTWFKLYGLKKLQFEIKIYS